MSGKIINKRKTLYCHTGFRYGHDAQELSTKAMNAIRDLMEEYVAKGYNPREIAGLI